jgi:hypothetical protein
MVGSLIQEIFKMIEVLSTAVSLLIAYSLVIGLLLIVALLSARKD